MKCIENLLLQHFFDHKKPNTLLDTLLAAPKPLEVTIQPYHVSSSVFEGNVSRTFLWKPSFMMRTKNTSRYNFGFAKTTRSDHMIILYFSKPLRNAGACHRCNPNGWLSVVCPDPSQWWRPYVWSIAPKMLRMTFYARWFQKWWYWSRWAPPFW